MTHVEDGDDGRVVPADDGGNVLGLGNLRGDQLESEESEENRSERVKPPLGEGGSAVLSP